jgi:hypothetical protein
MDTRTGEVFRHEEPMTREKRRRMERAAESGHLVEVSERVAGLMEAAQKAEAEAKAKRKAAKAARKVNR